MTLSGKEKRKLRAEGNKLRAELQLGKEGISAGSVQSLNNSFNTKELVKVKILETFDLDKSEAARILAEKTGSAVVQILGNTILLFRRFPEETA